MKCTCIERTSGLSGLQRSSVVRVAQRRHALRVNAVAEAERVTQRPTVRRNSVDRVCWLMWQLYAQKGMWLSLPLGAFSFLGNTR